jgi:hypothetical protein
VTAAVLVAVASMLGLLFLTGFAWGSYRQLTKDWRIWYRQQERLMADFTVLVAEVAKLIVYAQTPKVEDPAIQAQIDKIAADVKAVNDAVAPPA